MTGRTPTWYISINQSINQSIDRPITAVLHYHIKQQVKIWIHSFIFTFYTSLTPALRQQYPRFQAVNSISSLDADHQKTMNRQFQLRHFNSPTWHINNCIIIIMMMMMIITWQVMICGKSLLKIYSTSQTQALWQSCIEKWIAILTQNLNFRVATSLAVTMLPKSMLQWRNHDCSH